MNKQLLLIVGGGIAAYKMPEFVRRARDRGFRVRCVMTEAAHQFVTPLSLGSVSGDRVYGDLFSLTEEHEMGHIRLARDADLVVVAPATADLIAKAAHGLAGDLATTILVATDRPVLIAPAMNPVMWQSRATQRNLAILRGDGVRMIGPDNGDTACGEEGAGRMAEPLEILKQVQASLAQGGHALAGMSALVTSGPTHEPLDPIRYIANRSSGKQGHAIAATLAAAGATVKMVTGPVHIPDPPGVRCVHVESASEMIDACMETAGVDIAVFAAAVADWRPASPTGQKLKKTGDAAATVELVENPDILATVAGLQTGRPALVVGFAAETGDLLAKAQQKRRRKGCDWMLANDVAAGDGIFGSDHNKILLIDEHGEESWPILSKIDVASRLVARIIGFFEIRGA